MRSAWAFASARAAVVAALVAAGPPEPSAARSDRPTPVTTIVWSGARPAEPGYSGYGYETAEPLAALPLAPAPTVVGPLEVPPPSSTAGAPSEVEPLGRRESCVEKTTGPRASTTPPPATAPRRSPTSRASPMERRALDMSAGLRAALAAAGRGGRDMTRDARHVVQVQRPRGRRGLSHQLREATARARRLAPGTLPSARAAAAAWPRTHSNLYGQSSGRSRPADVGLARPPGRRGVEGSFVAILFSACVAREQRAQRLSLVPQVARAVTCAAMRTRPDDLQQPSREQGVQVAVDGVRGSRYAIRQLGRGHRQAVIEGRAEDVPGVAQLHGADCLVKRRKMVGHVEVGHGQGHVDERLRAGDRLQPVPTRELPDHVRGRRTRRCAEELRQQRLGVSPPSQAAGVQRVVGGLGPILQRPAFVLDCKKLEEDAELARRQALRRATHRASSRRRSASSRTASTDVPIRSATSSATRRSFGRTGGRGDPDAARDPSSRGGGGRRSLPRS